MIGVVIVNYGPTTLLEKYAASVQWSPSLKLYVVDNFSTPHHQKAVQELGQRHGWHVITLATNRGFGAGCNAGFTQAIADGADAVIAVNPDVRITAKTLLTLGQHVIDNPHTLVSPKMTSFEGAVLFNGAATSWANGFTVPVGSANSFDWLTGAVLAMSAAGIAELGGFDEDYFMYWEDVELSVRAVRAGFDVVVREDVVAQHEVSGTQESTAKSPLYLRTNCANRLRFIATHGTAQQQAAWRRSSVAYAKNLILRSGSRKYLAHPGMWASVARGTWQGLTSKPSK